MAAVTRRLPFGLAGIVAPSVLGFLVINSFTFGCDLGLLTALHGGLRWLVFRDKRRPARGPDRNGTER
jgi:hypothetical protein